MSINTSLYDELNAGIIPWGDLLRDDAELLREQPVLSVSPITVTADESTTVDLSDDALDNYVVPEIRTIEDIKSHFPVSFIQLSAQRYAIVWNAKNLNDWRNERAASFDEFQDYESYSEIRLFHTLNAHSQIFTVLPARSDDELCVVTTKRVKHAMDVLKKYPVTWDRNGAVHGIKPHLKKMADLNIRPEAVRTSLLAELDECADCVVDPSSNGAYLCVVTLLTETAVAVVLNAAGETRAIDVLKRHPVIWTRDGKHHTVSINNKRMNELQLNRVAVKTALLEELATAKDCVVCVCDSSEAALCVVTLL